MFFTLVKWNSNLQALRRKVTPNAKPQEGHLEYKIMRSYHLDHVLYELKNGINHRSE